MLNFKKGKFLFFIGIFTVAAFFVSAQTKDELKKQVEELENQVNLFEKIINDRQKQTKTLNNELNILNKDISKKELEIKRTELNIKKLNLEISDKEFSIEKSAKQIDASRRILVNYLRDLYELNNASTILILLKSPKISDFFLQVKSLKDINNKTSEALNKYKILKTKLEDERNDLEDNKYDFLNLKSLTEIEKKNLASEKKQKNVLLVKTKGEEKKYQGLLKNKKKDLAELKSQLFYLEATGITAEEALKYAELAAGRAGIRTSFLLALLEVETGRQFENGVLTVGTNLGSGNWKKDMYDCYVRLGKRTTAENQKKAYFEIVNKLNYDPDKMPVSRAPKYGCGGAIGPAQFLPATWLLFEDRVASLIGKKSPDPWKIEAAFMAAALYLSDNGADKKTLAAEKLAAKAYISGSSNCQKYICNLYSNNIMALAKIIDQNI